MALSKVDLWNIAAAVTGGRSGEQQDVRPFDLTGWQALALQGSYVYEVWRKTDQGAEPVYVGVKTGQGERPFNPGHHVLGKGFEWQDGDTLTIFPIDSPEIARWVEKVHISAFMAGAAGSTRLLLNKQPAYPEDLDAAFAATQPAPPSDKPVPLGAYLIEEEASKVPSSPAAEIQCCTPEDERCLYGVEADLPFDGEMEPVAEIAAPTAAEVEVAELERMLEPQDRGAQ
jgi:hypothetical protein